MGLGPQPYPGASALTELQEKKLANIPDSNVLSGGWGNYINGNTNPITIPSGVETKLTLDADSGLVRELLPPGVSGLWNSSTSQFDFSSLEVGDMVEIRLDGGLTTTTINDSFQVNLTVAKGSPSQFLLPFASGNRFIAGLNDVSRYNGLYLGIDDADIKNFPAEFSAISSDDASGFLIDVYVRVIQVNGS